MPHLPYSIELHDSEISAIESGGGGILVKFSHAYVHKDGKGWSQKAELLINSATLESDQTSYPAKVADGNLRTRKGPYHNLLTLPLATDGDVELEIEFFSGNTATIKGKGIDVVFTSEPVFIENVSII